MATFTGRAEVVLFYDITEPVMQGTFRDVQGIVRHGVSSGISRRPELTPLQSVASADRYGNP
jgi:hypothetical protein